MTGKQLVGVWLHRPDATNRSRNVADRVVGVDMPIMIDECSADEQEIEKEEHRTWSESPTNISLFRSYLGCVPAWTVWLGVVWESELPTSVWECKQMVESFWEIW